MLTKQKNLRTSILFTITLVIISLNFSACTEEESTSPQNGNPGANEVFMQGRAFTPQTMNINAETTIRWINKDNETHNVISGTPGSPSGLFNSGDLGLNGEFPFTFSQPGTYSYFCSHHAGMTGTITVQ